MPVFLVKVFTRRFQARESLASIRFSKSLRRLVSNCTQKQGNAFKQNQIQTGAPGFDPTDEGGLGKTAREGYPGLAAHLVPAFSLYGARLNLDKRQNHCKCCSLTQPALHLYAPAVRFHKISADHEP